MTVLVGISGTWCSGKTTTACGVVSALRMASVNAQVLTQEYRQPTFHKDLFKFSASAHRWAIHNLVTAQLGMTLSGGVDSVIVTDRTVLDYYAGAVATLGRNRPECDLKAHDLGLEATLELCKDYWKIFVLGPVPTYVAEEGRPDILCREAMWECLQRITGKVQNSASLADVQDERSRISVIVNAILDKLCDL